MREQYQMYGICGIGLECYSSVLATWIISVFRIPLLAHSANGDATFVVAVMQ